MSKNKDSYTQSNNFNDSQYNKDYYAQGGQSSQNSGQNYQQSDYVPQSYGASNRYDDLYDYEESGGGSSFLVGILVGGIVGAAAALFLAPKSGKEFQADLKTQATTLKEKASQQSDSSNDGSAGFAQQLKDQSTKVVDKVKNLKGGTSPMDDGTASSEGEESIDIHSTVQNSASQSSDTKGSDAFTSTANALKEAVEEVKEEKKTDSSSSVAGNTGSSTNSNTANSSKGPNTTSSNNNSNKSSGSNNSSKSSNNSSNNNYNKKN